MSEEYGNPHEIKVHRLYDMTGIEIALEKEEMLDTFARRLERAVEASGLLIAGRGTLRKYPGSIHWHIRSTGRAGTLEVTLWPARRRAWFSIQEGRRADWIPDGIRSIEEHMRNAPR